MECPLRINTSPHLADRGAFKKNVGLFYPVRRNNGTVLNQNSPFFAPKLFPTEQRIQRFPSDRLLRPERSRTFGAPFFPTLERQSILNTFHSDAALNRAHQRAKIATHTVFFIHSRDTFQRSQRAVTHILRQIKLGNRSGRNTVAPPPSPPFQESSPCLVQTTFDPDEYH